MFFFLHTAVGEDSEALSAAGQNETVLGCAAEDVLRGVQKCWGSMFAFTSASYRRFLIATSHLNITKFFFILVSRYLTRRKKYRACLPSKHINKVLNKKIH